MAREHWYFLCGMLIVALPLLLVLFLKKAELLQLRPDQRIVYKTVDDKALVLHAFSPRRQDSSHTPTPAIVLFHGGRWLYGNPRSFYPQCQFFAERGYHCFSAQYRLGVAYHVDVRELIEDAQDALKFIGDHALELHIDPKNIIAGGGSSGGHLAAMLGLGNSRSDSELPRPSALLLYNPMLDLSPGKPDHHLVKNYWRSVSPHHHIDDRAPPTLIMVGSDDPEVPLATAQAFCKGMGDHDRRCDLEIYEGQSHGFFNTEPYLESSSARAIDFLDSLASKD